MFYCGMVCAKNVVNMFIQSCAIACLVMVLWFLMGFSVAYGPDAGIWGGGMLSDGVLLGAVGVKDFAGGLVVHTTAGVTALMLSIVIGADLLL